MPNTNCLEGVRCPECAYEDGFYIDARITVFVTDNGTEDQNGDYYWDNESACSCANCKHEATLKDFTIFYQEMRNAAKV